MRLKGQRDNQQNCQGCGDEPQFGSKSLLNFSSIPSAVLVSATFPLAPNYCSCGSGFALGQVARANRSGQVSRLGQMSALLTTGVEYAVSPRGWRTPNANCSLLGHEGEGVLGVDTLNGIPWNEIFAPDISNCDSLVVGRELGKPKEQHGYPRNSGSKWDCGKDRENSLVRPDEQQCENQQRADNSSEHPAETRIKSDVHVANCSTLSWSHQ